jgi:hypothetical protein
MSDHTGIVDLLTVSQVFRFQAAVVIITALSSSLGLIVIMLLSFLYSPKHISPFSLYRRVWLSIPVYSAFF